MQLRLILSCLTLSASLAAGQVLFKYAANDIKSKSDLPLWEMMLSPWLIASLVLYAGSTALWIWILTEVPLSKAYPFALFATALVPVAAHFLFQETLSVRYFVGFAVVVAGLALVQSA